MVSRRENYLYRGRFLIRMSGDVESFDSYKKNIDEFAREEFQEFQKRYQFDDFMDFFVETLIPESFTFMVSYKVSQDLSETSEQKIHSPVEFNRFLEDAPDEESKKEISEKAGIYCISKPVVDQVQEYDSYSMFASHFFYIAQVATSDTSERAVYSFISDESLRIMEGLDSVLDSIREEGSNHLDDKYLIKIDRSDYLLDLDNLISRLSVLYAASVDEKERREYAYGIVNLAKKVGMSQSHIIDNGIIDDEHFGIMKLLY